MTDNELLLAISNIVGSHIKPLRDDIAELKADISVLKEKVHMLEEDVSILKNDVAILKDEVAVLKADVAVLKDDVSVLKNDVAVLKDNVAVLKNEVAVLKDNVSALNEHTHRIELTLENNVLPRLQNIESCYTSTYDRYSNGIVQLETMQSDIDVIKIVVAEHSKKIEKLA